MIASLLIANRGEIACRIMRTARGLGIRTVAVYSDADARALHVRQADAAVHIGGSLPAESYLRGDRIIAAARETGAEAIHPGYGFLSENADFAASVIGAGLVWIGPHPDSIRAMGRKDAAKRLMAEAGVPVTPGYLGDDQSPERLYAEAQAIGWPVLIKAVAGGGGKGMRRVDQADRFADALAACRREAASAFGDDRVLLEKYILSPRHIEVQLFGDGHGNLVHLFERDCSIQRRHQKVIEEAPAPGMDAVTREALCAAAVKAGRAVSYVGAGTVEFIADASDGLRADRIWFMEMNTRLQVEHPVTELITGVDLVEWQLRVASGEALPKRQEELAIDGHAIEARLYAEDPGKGFMPSVGRLERLDLPTDEEERASFTLGTPRVDAGYASGDHVSPFYDPMLAKLIFHAPARHVAAGSLASLCDQCFVWPLKTNLALLQGLLLDSRFQAGGVSTGFVDAVLDEVLPPRLPDERMWEAAALETLLDEYHGPRRGSEPDDPARTRHPGNVWREAMGFRLNADPVIAVRLESDGTQRSFAFDPDWYREDFRLYREKIDGGFLSVARGQPYLISRATGRAGTSGGLPGDGAVRAPMPGRITAVAVAAAEHVAAGQMLVTLEAMKMEQALVAPFDGVVEELNVALGAQVSEGTLLVRVGQGAE